MTLSEGDLEMDVPDALGGGRFDGPAHGLGRCMKAVDFVVELADRYLYIEMILSILGRPTERATSSSRSCAAGDLTKS